MRRDHWRALSGLLQECAPPCPSFPRQYTGRREKSGESPWRALLQWLLDTGFRCQPIGPGSDKNCRDSIARARTWDQGRLPSPDSARLPEAVLPFVGGALPSNTLPAYLAPSELPAALPGWLRPIFLVPHRQSKGSVWR